MINVGDKIPEITLKRMGADGMEEVNTAKLCAGKKIVLFATPGALTPTCSMKHLPGYVEHAAAFKAKGVDSIFCLSVNDPFVMQFWGKQSDPEQKLEMLPDGNGAFTRALGLEMDATAYNMGMRAKRFALIANNGVVSHIAVEAPGAFEVSKAEAILEKC